MAKKKFSRQIEDKKLEEEESSGNKLSISQSDDDSKSDSNDKSNPQSNNKDDKGEDDIVGVDITMTEEQVQVYYKVFIKLVNTMIARLNYATNIFIYEKYKKVFKDCKMLTILTKKAFKK